MGHVPGDQDEAVAESGGGEQGIQRGKGTSLPEGLPCEETPSFHDLRVQRQDPPRKALLEPLQPPLQPRLPGLGSPDHPLDQFPQGEGGEVGLSQRGL